MSETSLRSEVEASLVELATFDGGAEATFSFAPELSVFAGHFPGYALVPGVYLIEAVRVACEQALSESFTIETVKRARFTGEVRPSQTVGVKVQWKAGARIECDAKLICAGAAAASIRLILTTGG